MSQEFVIKMAIGLLATVILSLVVGAILTIKQLFQ